MDIYVTFTVKHKVFGGKQMRRRFLLVIIYCLFLFSSCAETDRIIGPKLEITQYSSKSFKLEKHLDLSITYDSGNLEIYTWNKREIKFEITKKIRSVQEANTSENKFNDFDIIVKQENNKVIFNSKYKGNIKNPIDRSIDLRIYLPQKNSNIYCRMDLGKIKIFDEINCNLNIQMNLIDTEINKFEGKLILKGDMGDLRLNGGLLLPDSSVKVNNGNIIIKSEIVNQGKYDFETGIGNIDLTFPKDSNISLEKVGALAVNEFIPNDNSTKVSATTGMGKISIRKY